jgi:hypothetical protein
VLVYLASDEVDEAMVFLSGRGGGCNSSVAVLNSQHMREFLESNGGDASLLPMVRSSATHTSHVTHHTSHVTPHTSHLTPHTSHLTPHTSHLTPHTSHATHRVQVDVIIMSQAKLLITSPGSTFGYAAAAAVGSTGTVMTVRPGGIMVTLSGARVFSHSKVRGLGG